MQEILRIKDLSVAYQLGKRVLGAAEGVSFSLKQGETICLVGESGSGKTTIAMAIPKLLPTSAKVDGEVFLNGESVYSLELSKLRYLRRKQISFIFQDPMGSLIPNVKIKKQLKRVISFRTETHDAEKSVSRAKELLGQVGLDDIDRVWNSYPFQLSGGMCQRVMIAMALSVNPSLVIADEPVSALDALTQQKILDLLVSLQKQFQFAMLFITHDMRIPVHYSNYVCVMNKGKVVEFKTTDDLYSNPEFDYSRRLIDSAKKLSLV